MIIRGVEGFYSGGAEVFLNTHPAIADVLVFRVLDKNKSVKICGWDWLKKDETVMEEDF